MSECLCGKLMHLLTKGLHLASKPINKIYECKLILMEA